MVERVYLAVVEGVPSDNDAVIEKPIARDRSHNWRFMIEAGGRAARTEVDKVVPLDDDLALVRCRLITGRTHQVRVHLAAVGHPVLGDRLYGSKRAGEVNRPLLHAASIALPHPLTGDTLRIECPPPADLARFLPDQSNTETRRSSTRPQGTTDQDRGSSGKARSCVLSGAESRTRNAAAALESSGRGR